MRQPPSPLLLSARKRRPRRNPPAGIQYGAGDVANDASAGPQAAQDDACALVQRDDDGRLPGVARDDKITR